MASNGSKGGGRHGAVTRRSQVQNPKNGSWTKRNTETGRFMEQKNGTPFKGVRREK